MKTAKNKTKEILIVGYKVSNKGRDITSLILGLKEDAEINYGGAATSGFEESEITHKLLSLLTPLRIEKTALYEETEFDPEIIWVKPVLVCEVAYKTITPAGVFKDVEFLWLREDKNISEHVGKTH